MNYRTRDIKKVTLSDIQQIVNDSKTKPKSPIFDIDKSVKVNNAYFKIKKGETREQATKRILLKFKHSIL